MEERAARGRPGGGSDEQELLRRFHEEGDQDARRQLIEQMMPLVRSLARRYANRGESLDDLEQVGFVGLIKAVDRFDVSRELRFSTFAVPTILGEIKRHFRDRTWSVRVSRSIQELNAKVVKAADRSRPSSAARPRSRSWPRPRAPPSSSCSRRSRAPRAYSTVPLDEPLGEDEEPVARLGDVDPGFARAEDRVEIDRGLGVLEERERTIVTLRFVHGLTQREIADKVGISQMHVSRLLRRSIEQMGERVGRPEPTLPS